MLALASSPGSGVVVLARSAVAVACPADTTEDILATITLPAGTLGPNGVLRMRACYACTSSANVKTFRVRWGGIGGTAILNSNVTASVCGIGYVHVYNRNSQSIQQGTSEFITPASSVVSVIGIASIDTSASQTILITGQKALAGETLTLESYSVEVMYGA